MVRIEFKVNGRTCNVDQCTPRNTTLNAYLRYTLALPGTKAMCKEGGCGACIVMVRAMRCTSGEVETFSVNSCLVLVFSCNGWEITTIEGVGDRLNGYDEVQKRIAAFHGTQCGYCTPGFVMHMNSLKDKNLTMSELEKSFGSNTCRCTGFRPILDTMKSFASDATPELRQKVKDIEDLNICKKTGKTCFEKKCTIDNETSFGDEKCLEDFECLMEDYVKIENTIAFDFGKSQFFKVFEENDVFDVLSKYGSDSYMLIDGNTGKVDLMMEPNYSRGNSSTIYSDYLVFGLDENFTPRWVVTVIRGLMMKTKDSQENFSTVYSRKLPCVGVYENFFYPRVLIDISEVKTLKSFGMDQNLTFGANVCLEDCIRIFKDISEINTDFSYLKEFVKHFELIAHIPVRKIGSLAGNLMLKHANPVYPSDVFLLFESVGAAVTIRDSNGQRICMNLLDFLKCDMQEKLIVGIALPPMGDDRVFRSYKIMARNQNSLAIVNAAFNLKINRNVVETARILYGNISSTFNHARETEQFLEGKNVYDNRVMSQAVKVLRTEIQPVDQPPEPSPKCRKKLAVGLFYKFILNTAPAGMVNDIYKSGSTVFDRPVSSGSQNYQTDPSLYPLNQPVQKLEAQIQSAGEARYANDLPPSKNDVFGAFVLSTECSGEVESINIDKVLAVEGILALYTASDIPGVNSFILPGLPLEIEDEEILATNIKFYGQPIAIIVAVSEDLATSEAKKVQVKYKNVSKATPILTIDVSKRDSRRYLPDPATIEPSGRGNDVQTVIKGVYEIESQYHYYMEPLTCVVVPVDRGLEVYDSTQWMDLTQISIARCLDMKESDIVVIVRRVGGAFGGRHSRNIQVSTAAALVARKQNKTCRFVLPIQTNMTMAGRRIPTQCDYEVGVNANGKIQYLNAIIVQDMGCSNNENVLSYVAAGFLNCYNANFFCLKTAATLTDLPSNTFTRAPGTAEGISSIEHIMEHIAFAVRKDSTSVRLANMRNYDNDLPDLINTLKIDSDYNKRAKDVNLFNTNNRWRKKALHISVMSFPVIYYGNYSALVSIYRADGTVTVTTGGIEMGQGLNTKAAQVCAYELGIPLESVSVIPHYSFTAANNIFSGSSIVSESVCYSIIKACAMLKKRLEPITAEMPNATWKDIIKRAGDDQIDLTAIYMMTDKEEDLKGYSAFAVCILEVELDVLTGRFQIDRVDILEDVGLSANPSIDVGQVEGAYIQGLGYFTCEKLVLDKSTGKLLTNRSINYHVPLSLDIPVEFHVYLRYNSKNPKGVLGSKACGEMGICSSNGINHALRKCISESRKDSGYNVSQWINIAIPYDTESILKALDVKYEEFIIA